MTRKWNIINNQSNANYVVGKEIVYNTEVLKCNLNCNDAYILVRGDITVVEAHGTQAEVNNCAPFIKCIKNWWNISRWCWRLRFGLSMYILLKCRLDYSDTTGSLWFYSKDEATNFNNVIVNTNEFKSFKYKAKLLGNIVVQPEPNQANGILKNTLCLICVW